MPRRGERAGERAREAGFTSEATRRESMRQEDRVREEVARLRAEGTISAEEADRRVREARLEAVSRAMGRADQVMGEMLSPEHGALEMRLGSGEMVDLRAAVPGGEELEVAAGEKLGYDPEKRLITVPPEMAGDPSAPVRILREVIRGTIDPYSRNGKPICEELTKRQELQELVAEQEQEFRERDAVELMEAYEKAEREASALRLDAERAIDRELERVIDDFKRAHGVDLRALDDWENVQADIRADLAAAQEDLVFREDKSGKGYYTGEKPRFETNGERVKHWFSESKSAADMRYRRKLGRVPVPRSAMALGLLLAYPAWQIGKKLALGARNLARNGLYSLEKRGFRAFRAGVVGVAAGLAEGFGKLFNGAMDTFLPKSKFRVKFHEKMQSYHDKVHDAKLPEPPWKKEVEAAKKKEEAEKKKEQEKKKAA